MLLILLLGAVAGLLVAFTGAGGGALGVPLLVFALQLRMAEAGPVALLAVGLSSGIGAMLGLREGIVRYRAAALMGAVGLVAAPLGVVLAQRIPNAPLQVAFAAVLGVVSWRMVLASRTPRPAASTGGDGEGVDLPAPHADAVQEPAPRRAPPCCLDPADGRLRWTRPCAAVLGTVGLAAGFLSGLLGVGGGFVVVPALTRYTDLAVRSIVATSMAVLAIVATAGVTAATLHGAMRWSLAIPFAAAAVVALLVGRRFAARVPAARLQQAFAILCLAVAALLLLRASGVAGGT